VCLGLFAVSGVFVNQALACGEAWNDWEENAAGASEITATAALNPPVTGSTNLESGTGFNSAPTSNGWIARADETIIGIASFYDDPQQTASGEPFDPEAFTAAAQLAIRDKFGGIRFGRLYQPAFAVAEYESKKLILKFNDVGPLRPGRKFDLSRAAMAYFGGLEKGLLPDFKVTPLPLGKTYDPGPVTDAQLAELGIAIAGSELETAQAPTAPEPNVIDAGITLSPTVDPVREAASPPAAESTVQPAIGES
jgi:rare lipoprotein A